MKVSESFIVGLLFIIGFLTVNISFVGTSEYQPVILLLLGVSLTIKYHKVKYFSLLMFFIIVFLALLEIYQFRSGWVKDFIRITLGPIWFLLALCFLRRIPLLAIKIIISIHAIFLFIGIFSPITASAIVHFLGLRGGSSYGGWNAYFSSEPSYFALNLSGLLAISFFLKNKEKMGLGKSWLLLCVLLLFSSLSLTGLLCGFMLSFVLFIGLSKKLKFYIACLTITLIFLSMGNFVLESNERLLSIITTIAASNSLLYSLNIVEPSGMWRFLMNSIGISMLFTHPFGIGGFDISSVFSELSENFPMLAKLIVSNSTYHLIPNFTAQSILPIYAVYGGFPMVLLICFYFGIAIKNIIAHKNICDKYFILFYLLLGFVWQSAITNPFWWILLGLCFSYKSQHGKWHWVHST